MKQLHNCPRIYSHKTQKIIVEFSKPQTSTVCFCKCPFMLLNKISLFHRSLTAPKTIGLHLFSCNRSDRIILSRPAVRILLIQISRFPVDPNSIDQTFLIVPSHKLMFNQTDHPLVNFFKFHKQRIVVGTTPFVSP